MSSAALYCDRKLPCSVVVGLLRPPLTAEEMTWLGVQLPSSILAERPAPTKLASTVIYNPHQPAGSLRESQSAVTTYQTHPHITASYVRAIAAAFGGIEAGVGLPVPTAARVAYVVCLFFVRGRVFDPPKICINAYD